MSISKESPVFITDEKSTNKSLFAVIAATNLPPAGTPEEWRPCPGYETHYAVSNLGRVMRTSPENNALVGRILKEDKAARPYPRVRLRVNGKIRQKKVHRLVAQAFLENHVGAGAECHHIDGCRSNNWEGNLEWLTNAEHRKRTEADRRTIALQGEGNINAALTWDLAAEIRDRRAQGHITIKRLAELYKVSSTTIKNLLAGRTWKAAIEVEATLPQAA